MHILPNCLAPFIVLATGSVGTAIVTEASLSFLGVGTPPPITSWGAMISGPGREFTERSAWITVFPGLATALAVFGVNLVGDALRAVWDPRLRGST